MRAEALGSTPELSSNTTLLCMPGVYLIASGRHQSGQSCSSSTAYQSLGSGPHRLPRILPRLPLHHRYRRRCHRRHLLPPNHCRRRRFSRRRHLRHGWRCMHRMLAVQSTCRRWSLWRSSLDFVVASLALRAACAVDAQGTRLLGARVRCLRRSLRCWSSPGRGPPGDEAVIRPAFPTTMMSIGQYFLNGSGVRWVVLHHRPGRLRGIPANSALRVLMVPARGRARTAVLRSMVVRERQLSTALGRRDNAHSTGSRGVSLEPLSHF